MIALHGWFARPDCWGIRPISVWVCAAVQLHYGITKNSKWIPIVGMKCGEVGKRSFPVFTITASVLKGDSLFQLLITPTVWHAHSSRGQMEIISWLRDHIEAKTLKCNLLDPNLQNECNHACVTAAHCGTKCSYRFNDVYFSPKVSVTSANVMVKSRYFVHRLKMLKQAANSTLSSHGWPPPHRS